TVLHRGRLPRRGRGEVAVGRGGRRSVPLQLAGGRAEPHGPAVAGGGEDEEGPSGRREGQLSQMKRSLRRKRLPPPLAAPAHCGDNARWWSVRIAGTTRISPARAGSHAHDGERGPLPFTRGTRATPG